MSEQQFNSWLMNGSGANNSPEDHLGSTLQVQIKQLDTICEFTDQQRQKLELAGGRDIARFIRRVDKLKAEVVGKSFPQNDINELWQRIQPLSQEWQGGIFKGESLFAKVLAGIMDEEQAATYEQMLTDQWNRQYAAGVKVAVATIERGVPMTSTQREKFVELFEPPPRPKAGDMRYLRYLVLYQLSAVPESELSAIFDEAQIEAMQQHIAQGRQMKPTLRSMGLLAEEDEQE